MIMTYAEIICAAIMALGMPNADFACKHMDTVVEVSEEYNLDPIILTALIHIESRWSPRAKSRAGACGLTQVIPKFSRKFGYVGCRMLKRRPKLAIRKGGQILSYWIRTYGKGDVLKGLCAYNAGYRCSGKNANKRGIAYAKKVVDYSRNIRDETIPGCMNRE
jgi:soluble lytic murein transglycosylase-like protein